MRFLAALCGLALGLSGCVQQAVLENDVRSAVWKWRTLTTASDLRLAHAALSTELVELEALYQRDPTDTRVKTLLARGYAVMARGFVELRYLEALDAGDTSLAEQERSLRADAEARARYYGVALAPGTVRLPLEASLAPALDACQKHDRAAYEGELDRLLRTRAVTPEQQLDGALTRALASAWLRPNVAARCGF